MTLIARAVIRASVEEMPGVQHQTAALTHQYIQGFKRIRQK